MRNFPLCCQNECDNTVRWPEVDSLTRMHKNRHKTTLDHHQNLDDVNVQMANFCNSLRQTNDEISTKSGGLIMKFAINLIFIIQQEFYHRQLVALMEAGSGAKVSLTFFTGSGSQSASCEH